jgi:hypothetical protein
VTAQLSPLRSGRITGSRVGAILGLSKSKTRDDVMREMVRDHFGDAPEFLGNDLTERGQQLEEPARAAYERHTGLLVLDAQEFVRHPEHDEFGVSPDGLIASDGLFEAKCPPPQWAKWRTVADRPDFGAQIQFSLACTGRAWCDFLRYVPGEPIEPERIPADPEWLPANLPALRAFLEEFHRIVTTPKLAAPYRNDLVALLDDPDSALDEAELAQIHAARESLDEREQQVRDRLIERAKQAGAKTARGRWFQVTAVRPSSRVRYKDALTKLAPDADLSEFTDKAAEPTYRISRVKESE